MAIILLTVTVMLLLFPLTAKQARSMIAMQRLQPEIKKLQAKYKNDRQKLNEEMMKFYQENKINPLGGCLPLLVQMPVFIALFHVLRSTAATVPGRVVAVQGDLAAEPNGLDVPRHGPVAEGDRQPRRPVDALPYYILVGAVFLTGFLQSRQSQRNTPPGANPQMQMITKVLPVAFGAFSLFFPAGLVLYFLVSNLWRLGQQELIMRKIAPRDHLRKGGAIDAEGSTRRSVRRCEAPPEPERGERGAEARRSARRRRCEREARRAPAGRHRARWGRSRDLFRPPADGNSGRRRRPLSRRSPSKPRPSSRRRAKAGRGAPGSRAGGAAARRSGSGRWNGSRRPAARSTMRLTQPSTSWGSTRTTSSTR